MAATSAYVRDPLFAHGTLGSVWRFTLRLLDAGVQVRAWNTGHEALLQSCLPRIDWRRHPLHEWDLPGLREMDNFMTDPRPRPSDVSPEVFEAARELYAEWRATCAEEHAAWTPGAEPVSAYRETERERAQLLRERAVAQAYHEGIRREWRFGLDHQAVTDEHAAALALAIERYLILFPEPHPEGFSLAPRGSEDDRGQRQPSGETGVMVLRRLRSKLPWLLPLPDAPAGPNGR